MHGCKRDMVTRPPYGLVKQLQVRRGLRPRPSRPRRDSRSGWSS